MVADPGRGDARRQTERDACADLVQRGRHRRTPGGRIGRRPRRRLKLSAVPTDVLGGACSRGGPCRWRAIVQNLFDGREAGYEARMGLRPQHRERLNSSMPQRKPNAVSCGFI